MKYHRSLLVVALLALSGNVIAQDCSVNVTPMAFGHIEPAVGVAVDSVADISVTCDKPTPFHVRLDAGQHSSDTLMRVMRLVGGVATLHYNLYLDASRTLIWGDGSGGGSTFSGISSGVGENTPVYGRIYGGQSPPPGSYVDSITVIVEW